MKYIPLGRTGMSVSRVCLGCMSFGDKSWRPWVLDEEEAQPFFKKAVEAGVNFFDTADVYSTGRSEEITGKELRTYANLEECVVATKVRLTMGKGPNMVGLSRKHIQQGCEASLRRLGIEAIDLYQIHRFDPVTPSRRPWRRSTCSSGRGRCGTSGPARARRGGSANRCRSRRKTAGRGSRRCRTITTSSTARRNAR